MKKLYQKIKINNFEKIRIELLELIPKSILDRKDSLTSFILPTYYVLKLCPFFKNFVEENIKKSIVQVKFYVSPPGKAIGPHIDGAELRQPFGLVLPIYNVENTFVVFYKDDFQNLKLRDYEVEPHSSNFECKLTKVLVPEDLEKLEVIETLELTVPTFTRSDVMHSVINNNDKTRITAVLRWGFFDRLEDIIYEKDILID